MSFGRTTLFLVVVYEGSLGGQPTNIDLLCDLLHSQLPVSHVLAVELDAQQPRGNACHIEVRHLIVDVDPLLVLGHHRVLRVGVVIDGSVGCHLQIKVIISVFASKMFCFHHIIK